MEFSPEKIARFKWPVTANKTIAASRQKIWETITSPGNLESCHPFCEKNPVTNWPGVGGRDTIYYYSGWVLHRKFTDWIEGIGYDLTIGREGGKDSFVSWRITEEMENLSNLQITIFPHALQKIPAAFRWAPHLLYIRPALQSYLESVVKGFDWFITTGTPVTKDQFGSHKWFSTPES